MDATSHCGIFQDPSALNSLSDTNHLYVHFVTDASINEQGFVASYKQVEGIVKFP